jgi:OOP family OmpA-OmpF porin
MQKTIKNLMLSGVLVATPALTLGVANAHEPIKNNHAYVVDAQGQLVRDGSGKCIRTGSWTAEHGLVECGDAVAAAPAPAAPAPGPEKPLRATLEADALFDFDKAIIKPEGKAKIDALVAEMRKNPNVETIVATGHTDRLGSEAYNQKLSERRVQAVKSYMVGQGIAADRIQTAAKGESEPVVACNDVKGSALIKCLAPNRRVEIEATVVREQ